jgi:hypothetical protein
MFRIIPSKIVEFKEYYENNKETFTQKRKEYYKDNKEKLKQSSAEKVQCDCDLLHFCIKNENIIKKEYTGYIFDKVNKQNGLFQYTVFLPELKLYSRI